MLLSDAHAAVADVGKLGKAARFLDLLVQDGKVVRRNLCGHRAVWLLLVAQRKRRSVDKEVRNWLLRLRKRKLRRLLHVVQTVLVVRFVVWHRPERVLWPR